MENSQQENGSGMMKIILGIIVILVLIGGVFYVTVWRSSPATVSQDSTPTTKKVVIPEVRTVTIKDSTFDSDIVTIKKGTTVMWKNEDSVTHKIASDPHPTHTDLPELISPPFSQGESFAFTFEKVGTFGYHCHLHPNMKGKVIVTE